MRVLYFFALSLVLFELSAYLANDMIMPGMLEVVHEFHASQNYVALSLSYYILGNCALLLITGAMAERYGKRKIMLVGNIIFLVFTILIMLSKNIHQFMLWRFFEGGGLSVIAIGYGLIHENFNDQDSVKLTALMGNLSVLAPLLGPVFGSIVLSYLSWRYIFIITAIMSAISLLGLYCFTPKSSSQSLHTVNIRSLIKHYAEILQDRQFLQGTSCIVLATMPILFWIGQAPNLILYKLQQTYTYYIIYQLISIGGMSISSLLMQGLAGKYSISFLVKGGAVLLLLGLVISVIGYQNMFIISGGLFVYTFGMGFVNGCVFRLIMSNKKYSSSMVASMLVFIQTFIFGVGMIIENAICHYFDYSLLCFTLTGLTAGIMAFIVLVQYIPFYREREWE